MSETKLPVDTTDFWKQRLAKAIRSGEPHRSIYDVGLDQWEHIQNTHNEILLKYLKPGVQNVLDAGCGIGSLLECFGESKVNYTGLDLSPEFIEYANTRTAPKYPKLKPNFRVGDLRSTPFPNKHFQLVICRSVEGMVRENLGDGHWESIITELCRVGDKVLLLNYSEPSLVKVQQDWEPEDRNGKLIQYREGASIGSITYRRGQDGTVELYDLYVDHQQRRSGYGRTLVQRLFTELEDVQHIFGFVRATNVDAIEFYKSCGFTLTRIAGFYRGQDAFLFNKGR